MAWLRDNLRLMTAARPLRSLLALLLLGACAPTPPQHPDIVLVVIDTLRADHLGAYGYARPTSPAIDALAAKGALFERAYSHAGWTLASFASLLTGQYPHSHRAVRDQKNPVLFGEITQETVTLAESLKAAGYATAAFVNNPFLKPGLNMNQGFDVYDIADADNKQHRSAKVTVDAGMAWLDQQPGPAFLLLHFMEPHVGYDPPAEIRGTFAPKEGLPVPVPFIGAGMSRAGPTPEPAVREAIIGLYDEEILAADQAVAELVRRLDERWWRTLLVVTADHGEELWDHGGFEHGHTLYGELVHVPLILAGAGAPPPGRYRGTVEHVDLFQGLVARAGAARPPGSEGTDLWTLATASPPEGRVALSESVVHGGELASVVNGEHRLVVDLASRGMELWEVAPDASEREQLAEDESRELGRPLFRALFDRRGGVSPILPNLPRAPQSKESEEQLRLLGYIDAPEEEAEEGVSAESPAE